MSTLSTPVPPPIPSQPSRADPALRDDVEATLRGSAISAEHNVIRVTVHDAHVVLTGRLARHSHLALASGLAASVPGVLDVYSRLDYVWED